MNAKSVVTASGSYRPRACGLSWTVGRQIFRGKRHRQKNVILHSSSVFQDRLSWQRLSVGNICLNKNLWNEQAFIFDKEEHGGAVYVFPRKPPRHIVIKTNTVLSARLFSFCWSTQWINRFSKPIDFNFK